MTPTTVDEVLPVAKAIFKSEGVELADDVIRAALTKDTSGLCSYRQMYAVIEEIMTLRAMS